MREITFDHASADFALVVLTCVYIVRATVELILVLYFYFSDVFLPDSPKIPGLKFDRDTSSFWYKPTITRNDGTPSS